MRAWMPWLAALVVAANASAQLAPATIALAAGLSVTATEPVGAWQPIGFTFGDERGLVFAATFARAASGRIVAIAPHEGIGGCAVLFTDDLGEHWTAVAWAASDAWDGTAAGCQPFHRRPGTHPLTGSGASRTLLAFDPGSPRGVATYGGRVLSTEDEGAHWTVRRADTSGLVDAWVRGRTVIFVDARGQLWRSSDGGLALETIGDPIGRVEVRDGDLFLFQGERPFRRVDARGDVHGL